MALRFTVVGLGNVGLGATLRLARLVQEVRSEPDSRIDLVDFDVVDGSAVRKGYPPRALGRPKATAAVETLRALGLGWAALRTAPHVAAIESVPGLLDGRDVFLCADSYGVAAFASERARGGWQVRIATGEADAQGRAPATVEVLPPGTTTIGALYDGRAWRASEVGRSCLADVAEVAADPFGGRPQPSGFEAVAQAVAAWRARQREPRPYRLTVHPDGRVERAEIALPPRDTVPEDARATLDVAYDAPLAALFEAGAAAVAAGAGDVLLRLDTPLVVRTCGCGTTQGFERFPRRALCPACRQPRALVAARPTVTLADVAPIAATPLRAVHAPAGLGFTAIRADGRRRDLALPFRAEDAPPLLAGGLDDRRVA
jgi:hypothetical protein